MGRLWKLHDGPGGKGRDGCAPEQPRRLKMCKGGEGGPAPGAGTRAEAACAPGASWRAAGMRVSRGTRSCAGKGGPCLCSPLPHGPDVRKRRHCGAASGVGVPVTPQRGGDAFGPSLCSQAQPTLPVPRAPSVPPAALGPCPLSATAWPYAPPPQSSCGLTSQAELGGGAAVLRLSSPPRSPAPVAHTCLLRFP